MAAGTKLEVVEFALGDLHTYDRNPRRGAVKAIAESLKLRGQYRTIVVNVGTLTGRPFEVLAGNHTLAAARSLGWATIQATTVDVDDAGAAQIVAADNRLADLGSYDDADLLEVLQRAGDLAGTGYGDQDVSALLRALEEPVGLTDPDEVPDAPEVPVSKLGDVWHLGPHRLLVGDSVDVGSARAVFDELGSLADCVWTDPPYGVSYVGGTEDALRIQNDSAEEAVRVTAGALRTVVEVARPGAPVYVAHADAFRARFQEAMEAAGIRYRQTLIWVKDSLVLGRADYHWRHEPILEGEVGDVVDDDFEAVGYGFTPGGAGRLGRGGRYWFGDNKGTTVFEVPRPKASRQHPTMKPVQLIEMQLRNSCPADGIVFDPFAGSGSTLIAAHRLRARAVLVELDPKYADVICRRWEEHSGQLPSLGGSEPQSFVV